MRLANLHCLRIHCYVATSAIMLALGALALGEPAWAQVSALPSEMQSALAAAGAQWNPTVRQDFGAMRREFEALHAVAPKGGIVVTKNRVYGPDPANAVDVYRPEGIRTGLPVVVFLHGGAYVAGDKAESANVTTWFARQGIVGVNANYRLAPKGHWPDATTDLRNIVKWTKDNVASFGGDPKKIFLVGHSAGSTHVATYVFDKSQQPPDGPGVAGAVLISGRYRLVDATNDPNSENMQSYFGKDPAAYAARSAITYVREGARIPIFTVIAEFELPGFDVFGAELWAGLCERNTACPRFTRVQKHNHGSEIFSFNTADEQLGREILDFMQRGK